MFTIENIKPFIKKKLDFDCCIVGKNIDSRFAKEEYKNIDAKELLEKIFRHYSGAHKDKLINNSFIKSTIQK